MKNIVLTIATGIIAGYIGAVLFSLNHHTSGIEMQATPTPSSFTSYSLPAHTNSTLTDFTYASAAATPSVVYVTTVSANQNSFNWMDWYFNEGGNNYSVNSGSGVIFSEDGYIITNNHVIQRAEKIEVVHNKTTYSAKVIGTDPSSDLAVLKIEAKGLPAIKLGQSSLVQTGEWVLAVGNPFNLTSTVTAGIVSAKGRNINIVHSQFPIESFIQTDAAINPGNSGGALVNTKGELIGINTAILSKTGSYTGYGFAVPSDIVKKIVTDIIKYGIVQKAFAGIEVNELNSTVAKDLRLTHLDGVYITYIQKAGAAEKAGLTQNDVIIKLNDKFIHSRSDFDEYLAYLNPGDQVKIGFKRDNEFKEVIIQLTNENGDTGIIRNQVYVSESLGADFSVLPKVEKDKLGLSSGVRIIRTRNGLISRLGLQDGYIITSVNNTPISQPQELETILTKLNGRVLIEVMLNNGSKVLYQYYF